MPQRKHYVELTVRAMQDAIDTMSEHVGVLHERARRKRGDEATNARKYADRIAASAKEIREALQALEHRLRAADAANDSPRKRP